MPFQATIQPFPESEWCIRPTYTQTGQFRAEQSILDTGFGSFKPFGQPLSTYNFNFANLQPGAQGQMDKAVYRVYTDQVIRDKFSEMVGQVNECHKDLSEAIKAEGTALAANALQQLTPELASVVEPTVKEVLNKELKDIVSRLTRLEVALQKLRDDLNL
jgi:hypothetical protein